MNYLLDYLKANFSTQESLTGLIEHFTVVHGVTVKNEELLWLFKYDQISVNWANPLVPECRGIILEFHPDFGTWTVICRPFNKFWNLHEPKAAINPTNFVENLNDFKLISKEDGTCIPLWYYKGEWRCSTLGMITPGTLEGGFQTFSELFFKQLGRHPDLLNLDRGFTYIFELCTFDNRVVSKYKSDRIYLLGARNNDTGANLNDDQLNMIAWDESAEGFNILRPEGIIPQDFTFKTPEEFTAWIEHDSTLPRDHVEIPEGWIIYWNGIPAAKAKNQTYLHFHAFCSGDFKHTKNLIIGAIFDETLDDYYQALSQPAMDFAEAVKVKVRDMAGEVAHAIAALQLVKNTFTTQKDFALWVQRGPCAGKLYQGFFYSHKEKLFAGEGIELFNAWIKLSYMKFEDYWKAP